LREEVHRRKFAGKDHEENLMGIGSSRGVCGEKLLVRGSWGGVNREKDVGKLVVINVNE
jgi:hypothetical protein